MSKQVEDAEAKLEIAMKIGDKEEIRYWRDEKRQLRDKENALRMKQVKLMDMRLRGMSRGAWMG